MKVVLLLAAFILIVLGPRATAQGSPQSAMSILKQRQLNSQKSATPSAVPTQPSIEIFIVPRLSGEDIPILGGIIHFLTYFWDGFNNLMHGKF